MLDNRLILPYAPLGANRKQPFTAEMELAAIVCLAEAKRKKKSGILRGETEKTVSISKLYYPLWLVPWENEYVTIDGMKVFSFETVYGKLPDHTSFTADVEKSKKSYERFMELLNQNPKTFKDFASSEKIIVEGAIQDKELQSALFEYFKSEAASKENQANESAFLKERLEKEVAFAKVNEIVELWKRNQADIETLQGIISTLDDAAEIVIEALSKSVEDLKQEFKSKIEETRPIVEEKVGQLKPRETKKSRSLP